MISNKDKSKLSIKILEFLYEQYHKTGINYVDLAPLVAIFLSDKIDEHDILLCLNSLKANKFVSFDDNLNDVECRISISDYGCKYFEENQHKFFKWLKENFFNILSLLKP